MLATSPTLLAPTLTLRIDANRVSVNIFSQFSKHRSVSNVPSIRSLTLQRPTPSSPPKRPYGVAPPGLYHRWGLIGPLPSITVTYGYAVQTVLVAIAADACHGKLIRTCLGSFQLVFVIYDGSPSER